MRHGKVQTERWLAQGGQARSRSQQDRCHCQVTQEVPPPDKSETSPSKRGSWSQSAGESGELLVVVRQGGRKSRARTAGSRARRPGSPSHRLLPLRARPRDEQRDDIEHARDDRAAAAVYWKGGARGGYSQGDRWEFPHAERRAGYARAPAPTECKCCCCARRALTRQQCRLRSPHSLPACAGAEVRISCKGLPRFREGIVEAIGTVSTDGSGVVVEEMTSTQFNPGFNFELYREAVAQLHRFPQLYPVS